MMNHVAHVTFTVAYLISVTSSFSFHYSSTTTTTLSNTRSPFLSHQQSSSPSKWTLSAKSSKKSDDGETKDTKENAAKRAALDGVLQKIERNYGRGSIVKLGDADNMLVECTGSGALTLGKLVS